jgi:tRNA(fMet)-specific endonuclease VapC
VRAELFYGAAKSTNPIKTLATQQAFLKPYTNLPFDESAAAIYGTERARLEKTGIIIGPLDLLIAAITLSHNLILVTNNTREFSRINGLNLEDWQTYP